MTTLIEFHSPYETLSRADLAAVQADRLRRTAGVHSLAQLHELGSTDDSDLVHWLPAGRGAVRYRQVHGRRRPVIVPYTRRDLDTHADLMARSLACAGVQHGTTIYDTGALDIQAGAEQLGAVTISQTDPRPGLVLELGPEVFCGSTTQALELADELGGRPTAFTLAIFSGPAWNPALRARAEEALGVRTVQILQVVGMPVGVECPHGVHLHEDHYLAELSTSDELILTTLTREAMPLLRYRTGIHATLDTRPCACGRTTTRLRSIARASRPLAARAAGTTAW